MTCRILAIVLVACLFSAVAIAAPPATVAQNEATSPFASDAEAIDFLRSAEVVSMEIIPGGVTKPRKVLLELDGVSAHAVFRDVELSKDRVWLNDGTFHMRLRDSALFEVAAYRLAVLLGLDSVPPVVRRTIDNSRGSLQLWVENALPERTRRERGVRPLDRSRWLAQMRVMALFDVLVGNVDRHLGNYLLDAKGKLWMIDHTRAFQMFVRNWTPGRIAFVDRELWERLQALDAETLERTLGDVLTPFEINKLVKRLDGVLKHVRDQIATRGERDVIT